MTGYLVATQLLRAFQRICDSNGEGPQNLFLKKWVAEDAYGAFLVHAPVLCLVGTLCDGWKAGGVVKTAVIGTANVVVSWRVSHCWNMLRDALRAGAVGQSKCRESGRISLQSPPPGEG